MVIKLNMIMHDDYDKKKMMIIDHGDKGYKKMI